MKTKSGFLKTIKARRFIWTNPIFNLGLIAVFSLGCSTIPDSNHENFKFPKKKAYIEIPNAPFKALGSVKTRVNFSTLTAHTDSEELCVNYYNKAAQKLVELAKKNGGDAVIQVRSVVFHMDGSTKSFKKAECFDNGAEGQVLAKGIAIRWKNPSQNKKVQGPLLPNQVQTP